MSWDDKVKGNWKELSGKIKQQWGKLTDDDIAQIAGKREELAGRLQKHYGTSREEIDKKIDEFLRSA